MFACPLQGDSSRGFTSFEQFYDIAQMRPVVDDILANYSCSTCSPMKKILYWVNKYYRYQSDISRFGMDDWWQFPQETLESGAGDCEDLSFFLASLMEAAGYNTRVVIGNTRFGYHAWVEIQDTDGQVYLVEGTNGKMYPWEHRSEMGYYPDLYITITGCEYPADPEAF